MTNTLLGAAAITLTLVAASGAGAQTRKSTTHATPATSGLATPAASTLPQGPAIPGVCVYSESQVIGASNVGKAFNARMQQLRSQAAAEVNGQETQLQTEEKALTGKRASLTQEQFTQQAQPLAAREQQLNQTAEVRTRELQATAVTQGRRLSTVIEPLVRSAYEAHHCSILIGDGAVLAANKDMDLTREVVEALNQRMSTITFDRESTPAQSPGQ